MAKNQTQPQKVYPIAAQIQTTSTIPLGGLLLLTMSLALLVGEMFYFLMRIVKTVGPLKGGNTYYATLVCYGLMGIGSILVLFFCIMGLLAKLKKPRNSSPPEPAGFQFTPPPKAPPSLPVISGAPESTPFAPADATAVSAVSKLARATK